MNSASTKNMGDSSASTVPQRSAAGLDPAHSDLKPQVLKVSNNVYVAIGYALANMIMIDGVDGIIIVDTTENEAIALTILNEFRKITKKLIKGIVLTHFHGDHLNGLPALLEASEHCDKDVKIYAHSTLVQERNDYMDVFDCKNFGVARQFGLFLGNDASDLTIGKLPRFAEPTDTFHDTLEVNLAGVKFTLFHAPGETRDQINVWIPSERVVISADNIAKAFPNISSIRGAPARDPEAWCESLDKIRRLKPEYLVPCHLFPIAGEKNVYDIVTAFRDAIQYVNDQTIRRLNDGYELDDVVTEVRLPPVLASHPYLQELYGVVEWSVRGIVQQFLGWFDRHPVNLFPLTKQENAERLNELLSRNFEGSPSGIEKMLIVARENLTSLNVQQNSSDRDFRSDLQWSLELLSHVLKAAEQQTPAHKEAMELAISCMKQLAEVTFCPTGKRYYLTCAKELPTNFVKKKTLESRSTRIQLWPIEFTMKRMKYSLRAEACSDHEEMTVVFEFSDVPQVHSYTLRHRILEYFNKTSDIPKEFDAKITCKTTVWKDLLTNKETISSTQKKGDLKVDGNVKSFERLFQLLDMCLEMHPGLKRDLKSVM